MISGKNCGMTSGWGRAGILFPAKEIYQTNDISLVLRYIEDKKAVLKPVTISCPVEEAAPAFQELKIRPLATVYCLLI